MRGGLSQKQLANTEARPFPSQGATWGTARQGQQGPGQLGPGRPRGGQGYGSGCPKGRRKEAGGRLAHSLDLLQGSDDDDFGFASLSKIFNLKAVVHLSYVCTCLHSHNLTSTLCVNAHHPPLSNFTFGCKSKEKASRFDHEQAQCEQAQAKAAKNTVFCICPLQALEGILRIGRST